jgi:hypothetical protein
LGTIVAAAVGAVDALLNAVGFQRLVRVGLCLSIGFLGGLVGGFVGEVLHSNLPPLFSGELQGYVEIACIVFGWVLTGICIGASIGIYDLIRSMRAGESRWIPLKKTLSGLFGGLLGGLLGGLPFVSLMKSTAIPRSNLAIGLVILGLLIGLFIGLVHVVLKEAWLKVAKGFRAGRELMLSKDETTIGRAEGCDLGLFGDNTIERLHARIVLKDNRYQLADAETPGGTYLNDERISKPTPLRSGDLIRVGNSVIEFGERQKRQ